MSGACAEQLVVDDADAAADIEEARALDAALADHAEQHVGGRVGPVALIPVEVGLGRSPVEDLEPSVAAAPIHGQVPKIASSSNGAVVSSWS